MIGDLNENVREYSKLPLKALLRKAKINKEVSTRHAGK
jgi:hypothetical protein